MHDLVRRTLEIATAEEGVLEEGVNRGARVEAYLRSTHLGPGYAWCAAFVYWCIGKAAEELQVPNRFICTAYCPTISSWARGHDILESTPQIGDVFLLYCETREGKLAGHTGFVISVNGARFGTMEGNTNLFNSSEGIGVFKRTRINRKEYKFVRWGRMLDEPHDETFTLVLSGNPVFDMPVRGGRALCPVRRWGEALGFDVEWNQEDQVPLFDGDEVPTEVVLIGSTAYAPIRDLANAAGLRIKVDAQNRKVFVAR